MIEVTRLAGPSIEVGIHRPEILVQVGARAAPPEGSSAPWVHAIHDLGAKGDGESNDTTPIQDALDDHRIVYLPPGKTFATNTLTMTAGSGFAGDNPGGYVQAGQTEVPDAAVSKLLLLPGTNAPLLHVPETASHVSLTNIELDGNDFFQSGALNLIDLAAVSGAPREARFVATNIYAHNSEGRVLFVGAGRLGIVLEEVVLTNALQEVVAFWGNDLRVSKALIGIGASDGIKIGGDVWSLTDTEVFSCNGAGAVIESRRGSIVGTTFDRNGGHGLYLGPAAHEIPVVSSYFHSNGHTTHDTYNHVEIKAGASARFVGCQWTADETGTGRLARWCVNLEGDPDQPHTYFALCGRDAGASHRSTPNTASDPAGLANSSYVHLVHTLEALGDVIDGGQP